MENNNCIFCKIAKGEIPSEKVYEDEHFYAFKDIRPAAPIHILVIPRKHIPTLSDCLMEDEALLGKLLLRVSTIAEQLGCGEPNLSSTSENGFRTVINTGPGGGQEVYHLHAHILAGQGPWKRMG